MQRYTHVSQLLCLLWRSGCQVKARGGGEKARETKKRLGLALEEQCADGPEVVEVQVVTRLVCDFECVPVVA
jgi:hypothetical protein